MTVMEEIDEGKWMDFEVGWRDEAAFLRLLEGVVGCGALRAGWLRCVWAALVNMLIVGKDGTVNRNEGLHSMLRGKLNRLVRRTKGYTKIVEMLVNLPCGGLLR